MLQNAHALHQSLRICRDVSEQLLGFTFLEPHALLDIVGLRPFCSVGVNVQRPNCFIDRRCALKAKKAGLLA